MSDTAFSSYARVVIIGGGVVGCSILFHLAKFGWKDVVLLERNELTSGSSWHAAGQIHTISSDPNISRLQGYTINLYKEIEATSGHSVGMHSTGGFYLASNEVWHDYLKRERSKARYMGLDQEFISVEEAARHRVVQHRLALLLKFTDLFAAQRQRAMLFLVQFLAFGHEGFVLALGFVVRHERINVLTNRAHVRLGENGGA